LLGGSAEPTGTAIGVNRSAALPQVTNGAEVSEAQRYIQRAEQLERIARESFVPEHRRQILQVAQDWRQLAEQVARIEQRGVATPNHHPLTPGASRVPS